MTRTALALLVAFALAPVAAAEDESPGLGASCIVVETNPPAVSYGIDCIQKTIDDLVHDPRP